MRNKTSYLFAKFMEYLVIIIRLACSIFQPHLRMDLLTFCRVTCVPVPVARSLAVPAVLGPKI